jgi:hypothetical protein
VVIHAGKAQILVWGAAKGGNQAGRGIVGRGLAAETAAGRARMVASVMRLAKGRAWPGLRRVNAVQYEQRTGRGLTHLSRRG